MIKRREGFRFVAEARTTPGVTIHPGGIAEMMTPSGEIRLVAFDFSKTTREVVEMPKGKPYPRGTKKGGKKGK